MIQEKRQETALDYVLGQMSRPEEAEFESEMQDDPKLRLFVGEMRNTTAAIGLTVEPVTPPRDLLVRILNDLRPQPAPYEVQATFPWIPWALAACLAIACGMLTWNQEKLEREVAGLKKRDVLAQVTIATLNSQVTTYAQAIAVVVWDAHDQRGLVEFTRLPALDTAHDYQLWVIDPAQAAPVSAGLVKVKADGSAKVTFQPAVSIRKAAQFALSVERKGGGTAPKGQIVLAGK